MSIRRLLTVALGLAIPMGAFAAEVGGADSGKAPAAVLAVEAQPAVAPVASTEPAVPSTDEPTPPAPEPEPTPPAPEPPAPEPPTPAPGAKGLSWLEISVFAPGLVDYNDAFKARLAATGKLKLKYLRRHVSFIAMSNPDPAIKAKAKQIAEDCKALIGS